MTRHRAGGARAHDPRDDFDALERELRASRDAHAQARLEAERLAGRSRLLADASVALTATLDPDRVLRRLCQVAVPAVADACEIALLEGNGFRRITHADGVDPERLRRREQTLVALADAHPVARVLRTGEPLVLDAAEGADVTTFGPPDIDTTAASFGISRAVIVPMTVRGRVLGAVALGFGPSGRPIDADLVELATELAVRAALSYDNARLFSQQQSIADTLQRSLLPAALPTLPWLELAARYWIPGEGIEVGGDFYDVIPDEPGVRLVMGDVCGKGIEAASLTALSRHTLRAALAHLGDPLAALRWLHDAFVEQAPDRFVTVALGRLEPGADGSVDAELVVAGHPSPVVLRAGGTTELVEAGGTAPGLPVHRDAPIVPLTLQPGDALVLYTDGVTDVPGDGALTTEAFAALVADLAATSDSAAALASSIGDRLEAVRPHRLRTDDIALLVAAVPAR